MTPKEKKTLKFLQILDLNYRNVFKECNTIQETPYVFLKKQMRKEKKTT